LVPGQNNNVSNLDLAEIVLLHLLFVCDRGINCDSDAIDPERTTTSTIMTETLDDPDRFFVKKFKISNTIKKRVHALVPIFGDRQFRKRRRAEFGGSCLLGDFEITDAAWCKLFRQ
jgi:hypothetical protein